MKITPDVFEAYLKCPTKCWLRSSGEPSAGATYPEWVKAQNDSYRKTGTERLLAESPKDDVALSPDMDNVKGVRWRLASSLAVRAQMDSGAMESELHAVERVSPEGRCQHAQFIPIRRKFNSKGIFTVKQLSYTFRARRRPKRLAGKREKYHHSLKALAIRERKIHIIGNPELELEGTPVYLDVEGIPDREFYYLIGIRVKTAKQVIHHSLWADSVDEEKRIWTDFLGILSGIENPVLVHYSGYETSFLKRMFSRYGEPVKDSPLAKIIKSAVNLLSFIFAHRTAHNINQRVLI